MVYFLDHLGQTLRPTQKLGNGSLISWRGKSPSRNFIAIQQGFS